MYISLFSITWDQEFHEHKTIKLNYLNMVREKNCKEHVSIQKLGVVFFFYLRWEAQALLRTG